MVLITAVFISALAYLNEISRERIAQNTEMQRIQSILYACNILPHGVEEATLPPTTTTSDLPWDAERLLGMMETRVETVRLPVTEEQQLLVKDSFLSFRDSATIYVFYDEGIETPGAFGFPLKGKGLWGTISAFGVVSAELDRMVGIDFTEQVETPGLGARITEQEFKYFFRELDLRGFFSESDLPAVVMVGRKERSNIEESTNSIQAITGATQTCNGVLSMLNTDLRFYLRLLQENKEVLASFNRI